MQLREPALVSCYHPLQGFRKIGLGGGVVFDRRKGYSDRPVPIPCGQCIGCRLERSRQWAVRLMHEASMHDANCFVTLTYDEEHVPDDGSLVKGDFQRFMKRLRRSVEPRKVRFFHCGEYGEVSRRPHYHALLFGFDFPDKRGWSVRNGLPVWRSADLERLWPLGLSELGSITFESAAYVARYVVKKVTGRAAESWYGGREAEYATMSRRPGIGRAWLEKYKCEVYPADGVVMRGRLMKPPRAYDVVMKEESPAVMAGVAESRARKRRVKDQTPERLAVQEKVTEAKMASHARGM